MSKTQGKVRAEDYTDVAGIERNDNEIYVLELRALAAILGPHGFKQLHEELLKHVGANVVEMKVP